jgi:hypothetical protein
MRESIRVLSSALFENLTATFVLTAAATAATATITTVINTSTKVNPAPDELAFEPFSRKFEELAESTETLLRRQLGIKSKSRNGRQLPFKATKDISIFIIETC